MIKSIFGIPVRYEMWKKQNVLPLYIVGSYEFSRAYIGNQSCTVIKPIDELATLPALRKHIDKIQAIDNVPVVLELEMISPYRRKSLILNQIPFITKKQIYLPFIGTLLEEEKEDKKVKKFVPSTQQLFLLYLYSKKKQLYVSEAAKKFSFTAMTLSRAVKQLEETDLFIVSKDGVYKVIESRYERYELFKKAKRYLCNPIKTVGYITKTNITKNMMIAGETALSRKTMLNPSKIMTYAVNGKEFDRENLISELIDPDQQICLELWSYDPKQFMSENCVDNLSLALSFMETTDERIEEAVEELLKRELGK